jgi:tRNA-dihydrouridine synthase B
MYKGEADWTLIGEVKQREDIFIPIFGNGDIDSPEKALEYKNRYGVDGMMIGRAAIGYPWIFREIKHFLRTGEKLAPPTLEERVDVCLRHLLFSVRWKGPKQGIFEMRRHYTNYFKGLPHFKEYRTRLVEAETEALVVEVLEEVKYRYQQDAILSEPIANHS